MLRYKTEEHNSKISSELSTFNLNWLCYKPILTMETDNLSQSGWMLLFYFLDLECIHMWHAVNHSTRVIQVYELLCPTICHMVVYMSVPIWILCLHKLYIYVSICYLMWKQVYWHMFYNCVIFVIVHKRKSPRPPKQQQQQQTNQNKNKTKTTTKNAGWQNVLQQSNSVIARIIQISLSETTT